MENFVRRTISTLCLITGFVLLIIFLSPLYLSLIFSLAVGLVVYETGVLLEDKKKVISKHMLLVISFLWLIINWLLASEVVGMILLFPVMVFWVLFAMMVIAMVYKVSLEKRLTHCIYSFFAFSYVILLLGHIVPLSYFVGGNFLVLFVVFIIKFGDVGAYIFGSKFGKRKIMPTISPKKSLEGCIANLVFSVVGAFALIGIYKLFSIVIFVSIWEMLVISIVLNLLGQFGDMSESLIKRGLDVKDSGKTLPGIGGLLDLVDSLVFAIPFIFYYKVLGSMGLLF